MDTRGGRPSHNENSFLGLKTSESFTTGQMQRKVDVLFVNDNSASMEAMQRSLGDRFASFASAVSGLDWQIGITTTDCSNGPHGICGSLVPMAGTNSPILTPNTPGFANVFKNTIVRPETVGCQQRGDCPTGDSTPLKAALNALRKNSRLNNGFFREHAALAIVMLTNADEDNIKPNAQSITPKMVRQELKNIWRDKKKMRAYAIAVLSGDNNCLSQQSASTLSTYGTYPTALAEETGGLSVSICAADYTPILSQIGDDLQSVPNFIQLSHRPNPTNLKVVIAPDRGITWTLQYDSLYFSAPLPPNTTVHVEYEY